LVLGLTIAGFFVARLLGERDARRESEHSAEVAAAQIRARVEQGASLAESLRRFMVGVPGSGVTSADFASNSARWLSPAGFPAAGWVEPVPASRRATYERRIGHPIVTRDRRSRIERVGSQSALRSIHSAAAVMPWIILGAGLVLAALAVALGVNAARRARAQDELDRIFRLSPDLITVADFEGHFTRVNPAVEQVLGYTEEEFLARPYLDLIHPDDRERTAAEAAAIGRGKTTLFFENRFIAKDGSPRVLEWTTTAVVGDGLMYGVARDVTERRQAETELRRLAGEHAALRRVATLVAKGVSPAEVFAAVAEEVEQLLDAEATAIGRLELDGTMAVVASRGTASDELPVGTRLELESNMAFTRVVRTGRSARIDDYSHASDVVGERARRLGIRCTVAVPIMVEGSLWGSIAAMTQREHFAADAEQRMAEFTELAGTALANAQSRSELTASRARVVAASDQTRRQIERDLHDGAQQRLVHTVITLKMARQALQTHDEAGPALVAEALDHAERATVELRELVQGILPPVLTLSGLRAAVRALADRTPVPVEVGVAVGRFPAAVEATAYFVVAEALTNVAKHSGASQATVVARVEDGTLQIEVRDDGVGGARADGSGFVGLADRLAVLDGQLRVESPAGRGTLVAASIRLSASPPDSRERWPTLSETVTRR
jgi:PAS domain S-box-containing protein